MLVGRRGVAGESGQPGEVEICRAGPALPGPLTAGREAPIPPCGHQILEITIPAGSPAAGRTLGEITWPHERIPVTVMDNQTLRDPDPGITLTPGDRVNLLARQQAAKSP